MQMAMPKFTLCLTQIIIIKDVAFQNTEYMCHLKSLLECKASALCKLEIIRINWKNHEEYKIPGVQAMSNYSLRLRHSRTDINDRKLRLRRR